jgi:chemotaxis protein CheD
MEIPGQFADTAIPHLLALLEREGARRDGLVAKVVGGAQMFGRRPGTRQDREPDARGPMQIGEANLSAVTTILAELAIPLRGKSVGGTKGRKFSFCCNSGELMVEVAGEAPFIL